MRQLNTVLSFSKYNFIILESYKNNNLLAHDKNSWWEKTGKFGHLDFTKWEEGDIINYFLVKLWDQCVGEVYKNKQRRTTHGAEGRKIEHLDQERTKEITWFLRSQWRQTCKQSTRWAVYSNNKKYCRVRGSCGDGHRRKQKYCSAKGKGFQKVTDIRKHMEDNHKGEEDEDQGRRRGLMSLGDLEQARTTGAC